MLLTAKELVERDEWLRTSPDALKLSPVIFAARIGLYVDPWQRDVLASKSQHVILNCARQSGKSTITAVDVACFANANPGTTTLCISSDRQVKELFRKIKTFLRAAGIASHKTNNANEIELSNGSRIVVVPNNPAGIRGYSPDRVVCDESAFLDDDIYAAFSPMVAVTKGRVFLLSTPNGRRGFFSDVWHDGGAAWERHMLRADQNPRISPEWLAEQKRILGERRYRQEYMCEFLETNDQVFTFEQTRAAMSPDVKVLRI